MINPAAVPIFESAKDSAQQMMTALLAGDRDLAGDIAEEFPAEHQIALSLVLADLCAAVHKTWCTTFCDDTVVLDTWQAMMMDIEVWRNSG